MAYITSRLLIAQINEDALPHGIVAEMLGREQFLDTDSSLGERMYSADIFSDILHENNIRDKFVDFLDEIIQEVRTYDYVQIINVYKDPKTEPKEATAYDYGMSEKHDNN